MKLPPLLTRLKKSLVACVVLCASVVSLTMIVATCASPPAYIRDAHAQTATPLVLVNGAIYTVNPQQPWAEAISIKDGIIQAVGTTASVLRQAEPDSIIVDVKGRMVMPGIHDPHVHALEAGLNQDLCPLPADVSIERYRRLLRACASQQADEPWVRGVGVSMSALLLQTHQLPIDILDAFIPDRPALILDDLGHGAWANTQAMKLAGYSANRPDPRGGILHRDPRTGQLSGVVFENAQQALRNAAFPPTQENVERAYQGLLQALQTLAQNGITSVSDAGGYWPRGHERAWLRAEAEGRLTVRASNALYVFPDRPFKRQIRELTRRYSNRSQQRLRFNQAKIYVDGILSQGTAALYEPYDQDLGIPELDDHRGFLYFSPALLNRYTRTLEKKGFQIHFHVVGDRATGLALDAIEFAHNRNGIEDRRHRLTHVYLIDERDRPRFKALNVVADFQLTTSSTSNRYVNFIDDYIGQRADELLPAEPMLDTGATVVLSSDWDADTLSPFRKMQAILTRSVGNISDLETVIRMMTLDGAYLLHQEQQTGSIEPGKLADLVVLDRNLFDIPTRNIRQTNVVLTLLEGEAVYDPQQLID